MAHPIQKHTQAQWGATSSQLKWDVPTKHRIPTQALLFKTTEKPTLLNKSVYLPKKAIIWEHANNRLLICAIHINSIRPETTHPP